MKSRSNNSPDMSFDNQKPTYDSLIHKYKIDELEDIKEKNSKIKFHSKFNMKFE